MSKPMCLMPDRAVIINTNLCDLLSEPAFQI